MITTSAFYTVLIRYVRREFRGGENPYLGHLWHWTDDNDIGTGTGVTALRILRAPPYIPAYVGYLPPCAGEGVRGVRACGRRVFRARFPFLLFYCGPANMTKTYIMNGLVEKVHELSFTLLGHSQAHTADAIPRPGLSVRDRAS